MKNLFAILTLLAALILACGCAGTTTDLEPSATTPGTVATPTAQVQDYTFTQTITYTGKERDSDHKNNLTKTATLT